MFSAWHVLDAVPTTFKSLVRASCPLRRRCAMAPTSPRRRTIEANTVLGALFLVLASIGLIAVYVMEVHSAVWAVISFVFLGILGGVRLVPSIQARIGQTDRRVWAIILTTF